MGEAEDNHEDNGKPKANITCRILVRPNTLQTSPAAEAVIQGHGDWKDVLPRRTKINHVPDHIKSAGTGHLSKPSTAFNRVYSIGLQIRRLFQFQSQNSPAYRRLCQFDESPRSLDSQWFHQADPKHRLALP